MIFLATLASLLTLVPRLDCKERYLTSLGGCGLLRHSTVVVSAKADTISIGCRSRSHSSALSCASIMLDYGSCQHRSLAKHTQSAPAGKMQYREIDILRWKLLSWYACWKLDENQQIEISSHITEVITC